MKFLNIILSSGAQRFSGTQAQGCEKERVALPLCMLETAGKPVHRDPFMLSAGRSGLCGLCGNTGQRQRQTECGSSDMLLVFDPFLSFFFFNMTVYL